MQPRLIYVVNARMPTEKAHGWHIAKMCEAFSDAGARVTLFIPRRRNPLKSSLFSFYGVRQNFTVRYLPCLDTVRFGKAGFYLQAATFALVALLASVAVPKDVIYSRDEAFSALASFFSRRLYYDMHDYPRSHRWLYAGLFRRAAKIVSTNRLKRERLIREFRVPEQHVIVQPNGVDLTAFNPARSQPDARAALQLPHRAKIVAAVGKYRTFGQEKGLATLIEAFPRISLPQTLLLLVGINADEVSEIESLLLTYGVDPDRYRIVGHIPHADIAAYLYASDVLVMSYPNTEHYREFMNPIKMFEYMASGTPIVSSDLPSIREVLDDHSALLVRPGDAQALAEGVSRILGDDALGTRLSRQARHAVTAYTWAKRAEALLTDMRHTL